MKFSQNDQLQINAECGLLKKSITRRAFLNQLLLASGLALAGCSELRLLLKTYPEKYNRDKALAERMMRAFVETVIPGAPMDDPNLARIFFDDYYPFASYYGFFLYDLSKRSAGLFRKMAFENLPLLQRAQVIESGLEADGIIARLYRAAIFIAQFSYYAGIYDDQNGCPAIEFYGENAGFSRDEICYPNSTDLLAGEMTGDGNYA